MKKIITIFILLIISPLQNTLKQQSIEHPTIITHLHAMAHNAHLSREWAECITKVRHLHNPKLKRRFTRMVYRMKEFSLFPLWLKNSFKPIWEENNKDREKLLLSLYEKFKPSKHIFSELSYKRQRISNPKETDWNKYKKEVIDYFLSKRISSGKK